MAFYQAFAERNRDDPNAQWEIAKAYFQVAEIQKGLEQDRAAEQTRQIAFQLLDEVGDDFPKDRATRRYFSEIYQTRGQVHLALGQYSQALSDFQKIIELGPETSSSYQRLAEAHFHLGKFDESLADLRKAVALNPNNATSLTRIPPSLAGDTAEVRRCRAGLHAGGPPRQVPPGTGPPSVRFSAALSGPQW